MERRAVWWQRTVAAAGCLAFAALALLSGADRIAAGGEAAAPNVPGPFAADAHLAGARAALAAGEGRAALAQAEQALAAAPLDPASSATLGAARAALGDRAGADRAFRVAGQLGWRIFYTQAYWIERALEVRDYRVASLRLDALARQDPSLLRQRQLLDPLETDPAARHALVERLATAPWRTAYAGDVAGLASAALRQRALVLGELAQRGEALGCDGVASLVGQLIAAQEMTQAGALWRGHCPAARGALIYDGELARAALDHDQGDFAWSFAGQDGVSMVLEPAATGSGRQLAVSGTARRQAVVMRQLLVVPAGRYRLSWRALAADGQPSPQPVPLLGCYGAAAIPLAPNFDARTQLWSSALTIDGGCPAHWLSFAVGPGAARFALSAISLDPTGS